MQTHNIGHSQLPGLLAQGMGQELHWFPEDVPVSRLAATLVGMANAYGGTILVGVAQRTFQSVSVEEEDGSMGFSVLVGVFQHRVDAPEGALGPGLVSRVGYQQAQLRECWVGVGP